MTYRHLYNLDGSISTTMIQRIEDTAFIPTNIENRDYREFLEWEKQGGKIEDPLPVQVVVDPAKEQAKLDLNNKAKTDTQRIDAIISYLGLDK